MNKKMSKLLLAGAISAALAGCQGIDATDKSASLSLQQMSRVWSPNNVFDKSAAEIVAFDPATQQTFVVNSASSQVDVFDSSDLSSPSYSQSLNAKANWLQAGAINSVDVANGYVVVAVENKNKQANGQVMIYHAADLSFISRVEVGALPDMITFIHSGKAALVAIEGEPSFDYQHDPEGAVGYIDLHDIAHPAYQKIGFQDFNKGAKRGSELPDEVRITGNYGATELAILSVDSRAGRLDVIDSSTVKIGDRVFVATSEGDPLPYTVEMVEDTMITLSGGFDKDSEIDDSLEADGTKGVRVFLDDGQSSVAQDLEPEYIAVSDDDKIAFVTLQENNAVAVIDLDKKRVQSILALGSKDYSVAGNEIDASDKDGGVNIQSWPVYGLYQPDSIASYTVDGQRFFVTANEGDARSYGALVNETRVKALGLSHQSFNDADYLMQDDQLGRLKTPLTEAQANSDADGLTAIYSFGSRSFSIWTQSGEQVFDSGSQFAKITAEQHGDNFNNTNSKNAGDNRSDDKGAEPEALIVATVDDQTYAFIGLERTGGIMVYNITQPERAHFVQYINNRDFDYPIKKHIKKSNAPAHSAGDLGPEGMAFIAAKDSPNGKPVLIVGNEVSGTTTFYQINKPE